MEIEVHLALDVVGCTDPGVGHYGGPAARLHGRGVVPAHRVTVPVITIEGVVRSKLVAQLMGHIVKVEGVPNRASKPCDPPCLGSGDAGRAQGGHSASACAENVPDVIVGSADDRVEVGLVLPKHCGSVIVGVGIGVGVEIDDVVVVGYQFHAHGQVIFKNRIDPCYGRGDRCKDHCPLLGIRARTGSLEVDVKLGIFSRRRNREPEGSQLQIVGCLEGRLLPFVHVSLVNEA